MQCGNLSPLCYSVSVLSSQRGMKLVHHQNTVSRAITLAVMAALLAAAAQTSRAQHKTSRQSGSHSSRATLSSANRALIEEGINVVCTEAKLDPESSVAIDEMQARPSLPLSSSESQSGASRAQKLLPIAKVLVEGALRQLAKDYGFRQTPAFRSKLEQAILRVQNVRRIRPDMESRDNASVFLSRPHTITFGTIFLAGLRSDEGMISVLAHELTHIADGDSDGLKALVLTIANKATRLTGLDVHGQRGEELACDLVGAMAVQAFVGQTPSYDSIARRLSRSVQHNCVDLDEGDDEHLSPRNTIRAVLSLQPDLTANLVYDRLDHPRP